MKKSVLYTGIGYVICSIALILFGKFGPGASFKEIIIGFAAALLFPGITMICKYIRWSKPQNRAIYKAKMKEEEINIKDERKIMIRDKSAYITYNIMTWLLLFFNLIFSAMEINIVIKVVLWTLWLFHCTCPIGVSKHLEKKL